MKNVLITGISKGIGKALAEKFLSEGYGVLGTSIKGETDYSAENLKIFELDLANQKSIEACVEAIGQSDTKIDILINNAGVILDEEDTKVVIDKLRNTLEINLIGTIDFTEKIIPNLVKGGHIINISSSAGSLSNTDRAENSHFPNHYPAYKISKAALNMYTRTLALRLTSEKTEIIVLSVHPGWVKTDMGGAEAPILPVEAAEEIYKLATSKVMTGGFWFKGEKFPW